MKDYLLGIDIGSTKFAVNYGCKEGEQLFLFDKERFPTTTVEETIDTILQSVENMMQKHELTNEPPVYWTIA